ncbi:MAG: TetR/AcrR family transcriptional regulator [Microthrixaceae bacterium]
MLPAKQSRSQETLARILNAADSLLSSRTFKEISVHELCLFADVSSSSFYARFHSKQDVLLALFELHSQQAQEDAFLALTEIVAREGSSEEKVRALLGSYLCFVRRNGAVMVSIFAEPSLVDRYWNLSSKILKQLEVVLSILFDSQEAEFLLRAEFATRVATASIQRAVGLPSHFGERMGLKDSQMVDELTAMLTPYLLLASAK